MHLHHRPAVACLCALALALALVLAPVGCDRSPNTTTGSKDKIQIAFVTNNVSPFWQIARAGVNKAMADFGDVHCDFQMPADGTAADQQRIVEALIAKGISGMAISPNDAANQIDMINRAAEAMNVICHDSDAPNSNRLAYVGTNNYLAGREAGKLIKQALPDGGSVMLFVGRMDAQNAIERRLGIIDELKGAAVPEGGSPDLAAAAAGESGGPIELGDWTILDTRTDLTDRARAKQNVEDTLTKHPDVGALVGLWSYNTPAILSAVRDANMLGKVKVVGFDEEDDTFQGVKDGHVIATVAQLPYEFGYESVRVLRELAKGNKDVIPPNKIIAIPVKVVTQATVDEFWQNLREQRGSGKAPN